MGQVKIWSKIAKSGLAYHINIPKQVWEQLLRLGVRHRDIVVWDTIENRENQVEVKLIIYKSTASKGVE